MYALIMGFGKNFLTDRRLRLGLFFILCFGFGAGLFHLVRSAKHNNGAESQGQDPLRIEVEKILGPAFAQNQFVNETEIDWLGRTQSVQIHYSFDDKLQKEAEKLLRLYRPDYGVIVTVEPATGKILSMASYEGGVMSEQNWALRATFPAASIFKVITAAAAIDKYNLSPELEIPYDGANHTLYKRNLFSEKNNRWTRRASLKEAFGRSINIFFGKLSLQYLEPEDLLQYAQRFQFNAQVPTDLPLEMGFADIREQDDYHVAEIASGFNRVNRLSPLHGAMIAAAIAQDGLMKAPYVVERIENNEGKALYTAVPQKIKQVITPQAAQAMRELMEETVTSGTSKKSFREILLSRKFRSLELGGKTGSLTGNNPRGKTDWFIGYGRLEGQSVAVAAITVNKQLWRVKSAYLAQRMIREYFDDKVPEPELRREPAAKSGAKSKKRRHRG